MQVEELVRPKGAQGGGVRRFRALAGEPSKSSDATRGTTTGREVQKVARRLVESPRVDMKPYRQMPGE